MSSCNRSNNVLSYLMGELNEDDKALFEKHLESCPICRLELRLERVLQTGLVECTQPEAAPAELKLNVLSRIQTMYRPRFPFWQIAVTLLSGSAAFLILLRILRGSSLPETGIVLLTNLIDDIFTSIKNADSIFLMIGAVVIFAGIASILASLLPEE